MVDSLLGETVAAAIFGCGLAVSYSLHLLMTVHYMGLKNLVPILALGGITAALWLCASIPLQGET